MQNNGVELNKAVNNIALIDIEFTGLDNQFINDNEIIQVKIINGEKSILKNFNSNKPLSAYVQLEHKCVKYSDCDFFDNAHFISMLTEIGLSIDNTDFFGFGVDNDIKMLSKYGVNISVSDIRTHYQLTEFAYRMATEGSGLEETYFIVTGEYPPEASHSNLSEMLLIKRLFDKMNDFKKDDFYKCMPHGFCSGMPLEEYVESYRRQADGYRFNNIDLLSYSLSRAIGEIEYDFDEFGD